MDIEDGGFLILGDPSWCGKSTTLHCVAGLETPTDLAIRIDGRDVTDEAPQGPGHGYGVPELRALPAHDVRENMSFDLKILTDEIDRRIKETAERLGIAPLLEDTPDELSSGQQQRVALGPTIVGIRRCS